MFPNCPQDCISQKFWTWNETSLLIHFVCFSSIFFHHAHFGAICFNHNKLFFSKQFMLSYKFVHLHTSFSLPVTFGPSFFHLVNCIHQSGSSLAIISSTNLSLTPGIWCTHLVSNGSLCLFLSNHSLPVNLQNENEKLYSLKQTNKQSLQDCWDNIRRSNIHVIKGPKEQKMGLVRKIIFE